MLRKRLDRNFTLWATLALAVLGLALRLLQRRVSLQADGQHSAALLWTLILLSALALLFAGFSALRLRPRQDFASNSRPCAATLLGFPAALLLAAGGVLQFLARSGLTRWLVGALPAAGGLCLGAVTFQLLRRRRPSFYLYAGLTVSLICKLIPDFRSWTVDPNISDYCFSLFSMLAVLCVSFELGGFVLDRGDRRAAVFFAVLCPVFSAMAVADGGLAEVFSHLAYGMFAFQSLAPLLAQPRRRRRRPAQ